MQNFPVHNSRRTEVPGEASRDTTVSVGGMTCAACATRIGKGLGKPLVMRLNLNQQSNGPAWTWHKNLIDSLIPIGRGQRDGIAGLTLQTGNACEVGMHVFYQCPSTSALSAAFRRPALNCAIASETLPVAPVKILMPAAVSA